MAEHTPEFYLDLPFQQGRVLAPAHPDPRHPFLGIAVPEEAAAQISLTRKGVKAYFVPLAHELGVVSVPRLTEAQRRQLDQSFEWDEVPKRSEFTRFPHTDDPSGKKGLTLLRRIGPVEGANIGFSAYEPGIEALLGVAQEMSAASELEYPGSDFMKQNTDFLRHQLAEGRIYDARGRVTRAVEDALHSIHHTFSGPLYQGITPDLHKRLRQAGLWLGWDQMELAVVSGRVLHWGGDGELYGQVHYTEVY